MREFNWHLAIVFLLPLGLYLATMPLTIALEDDGLFVMSSYFNGLSHPPGYPIHSLLGKLFSLLPVSTVAARVHAVSAVFGALSCVVLWLLIMQLLRCKSVAYAGAIGFAFSSAFWSQAIIAEVYTLNTFLFFSLLLLAIRIYEHERENRHAQVRQLFYLSAFVFGLSLCNHWPLMVLSAPCLLLIAWPTLKREPILLLKSIPFLVAGLLPYAWMVINSQTDPFVSYMGPVKTWQQFFYYVSRAHYSAIDDSISAGFIDKIYYLGFYFRELIEQFTWLGFALMLVGLVAQFRYINKLVCTGLIAGFLGNGILLVFLLGFDYTSLYRAVISVYFLVAYGIGAIWIATGIYYLFTRFDSLIKIVPALQAVSVTVFVAIVLAYNYEDNDRHEYKWGEMYARTVLESLPEGVTLFVSGDVSVGTIGYMHYVEGVRKDVKVLSDRSLIFRERIFDPMTTGRESLKACMSDYLNVSDVPVYTTAQDQAMFKQRYWLTRAYNWDYQEEQDLMYLSSLNMDYLQYIVDENVSNDDWTLQHRHKLLINAISYIVERVARGERHRVFDDALKEVIDDMDGFLVFLNYIRQRNLLDHFGGMSNLLPMAESLYQRSKEKSTKARYLHFRGLLELEAENTVASRDYFFRSMETWTSPKNASLQSLAEIFEHDGEAAEFNKFIDGLGNEAFDAFRLKNPV